MPDIDEDFNRLTASRFELMDKVDRLEQALNLITQISPTATGAKDARIIARHALKP